MSSNVIDLSLMTPEAVKSAVLKNTATNPLTIFPIFGSLLFLAFWVIFNASWIFTLLGAISFVGGVGMFMLNYFGRYDVFSALYFAMLRAENEEKARQKLIDIENFLDERNFDQGARQVTKLQCSMESFEKVLDRKFEPHEFARARYHGVAEQVMLNALANLEQVVIRLEATDSIDPDYIQGRIDTLGDIAEANDGLNDTQWAEKESLEQRWALRESHLEGVDALLSKNEIAMTELEKIASNIATSNTDGTDSEVELNKAIDKLNNLGEEAQEHWGKG